MKTMHSQSERNFDFTEKVLALFKPKSRKLESAQPPEIDQVGNGSKPNLPKMLDQRWHILSPAQSLEPAYHPTVTTGPA